MRICDCETDGLVFDATRMWINVSYDLPTKMWGISFDGEVGETDYTREVSSCIGGDAFVIFDSHSDHFERLEGDGVCYHNYFQFDKSIIKKLIDAEWSPSREEDTYILSQLYWPDRGMHSIDAWAKRLGDYKPVHEDWSKWDVAMIDRCISDVRIGTKVWFALEKEEQGWIDEGGSWGESRKIEYGIADLQGRQEMHGVMLDQDKAYDLADEIYTEIQKIDETLLEQMPLRVVQGAEVSKPFRKDGQLTKVVERWFE